jgi:hypothetical protein
MAKIRIKKNGNELKDIDEYIFKSEIFKFFKHLLDHKE